MKTAKTTKSTREVTPDNSVEPESEHVPGDLSMVASLWPFLLAAAVSLVPFTVFSNFLVPIAGDAGLSVAAVGSMRGLGGLSALFVGVLLAPLIDRLPKEWIAAVALVLLGLSSALGALAEPVALVAFCLLIGASTAMLNPALGAAAADRYGTGAAAGRAATLVTATQSMTAMLAAPVIAVPAMLWGWDGDLLALGVLALVLAALMLGRRRGAGTVESRADRPGYLASYRALAGVRGAVPLVVVGGLRTAAFMGYLAYLAAFYDDRFDLHAGWFSLVWTLSGASFFVGNLIVGRIAGGLDTRRIEGVLTIGALTALVAMVGFYAAPTLPIALAGTCLIGLSHAAIAACVVSLLVRRCGDLRGAALSVNAAGQSFGTFTGAGLGGIGLGLAGDLGIAAVFGILSAIAVGCALLVRRTGRGEDG